MITQWQDQIAAAKEQGYKLQIRGAGSKLFYGQEPVGEILDTRSHQGIVNYEPTELVVTARAGTTLKELENTLAAQQQMLAFEPPHFGEATVGGCVAAGLSGPRRMRAGALRDFVLGAQMLDGNGTVLNFGGQVMKNVAGYDISRSLAGSLGCLGIISEVSLKVLPCPELEQTQVLSLSQAKALQQMCQWASQPLPISATSWQQGQLTVRLSGAASAVKAAASQLGGDTLNSETAQQHWQLIKEHQAAFFQPRPSALWRISLPATRPALTFNNSETDPNDTLLEWNGCQRWLHSELPASTLRQQVSMLGGHATLFRGGDKLQGVFTPLSDTLMGLQHRLKQQFDPAGVFNPGRLYTGL